MFTPKPTTIRGVSYPSRTAAARALGVTPSAIGMGERAGRLDEVGLFHPLRNLTAEDLRPLWERREIPIRKIAAALGCTPQAVSAKAKTLGLPPRRGNKQMLAKLDDETFRRMWLSGVAIKKIQKAGGYASHWGVVYRRRRMGLPKRERPGGTGRHGGWANDAELNMAAQDDLAARWAELRQKEKEATAQRGRAHV